jgi:hypothetical protein
MEMLKVFMKKMGFQQSAIDYSVFYCRTEDKHTIVAIAIDNIAIISKQPINAQCFKAKIKEFWDITDHRPIKWLLGFEIKRDCKLKTINKSAGLYRTDGREMSTYQGQECLSADGPSCLILNQAVPVNTSTERANERSTII